MEDLLAITFPTGKPTNFSQAFNAVTQFLHDSQVPHVLIGTLALNTYISPRYTQEIQLICEHSAVDQVDRELKQIAKQAGFSGCIKAEAPTHPAMTHALELTRPVELFGTMVHVPTALALCWLFLEIDDLRSQVDAGTLLAAGVLASDELQSLLERHARDSALIRFGETKRNIEQGRYSSTYSDSVRARLQRLQQKDADANLSACREGARGRTL